MMKIAIIGAGISGLSLGRILQKTHDVTIFEKEAKIGGMIKCELINSVLFHKIGGHVFNSNNTEVLDWFWSHFDKDREFIKAKRNAKIFINNEIIGYPIENFLSLLNKEIASKIIVEILELHKKELRDPLSYNDFESFLLNNFGETLYNIYFEPYNKKIWNTNLSTIPMPWLEGKLPMPNYAAIILKNILREEESEMVHSHFYYPKQGGSQFIADRLAEGLNICVSEEVVDIQRAENGKYTIGNQEGFDKIVYTGDIRQLPPFAMDLLAKSDSLDSSNFMNSLRSNGTSNLLCETDENNISWLYIPEPFTKAHRIIYTGNFSANNNSDSHRKTCVVEFSGKVEYQVMLDEIQKLPGNLKPISFNYAENSYVIQNESTRADIRIIKNILEEKDIYLLGRFAEWEYYNMDKCIESALKLADEISNASIV